MAHTTDAKIQALADEVIHNLPDLSKERLEEFVISLTNQVKDASAIMAKMALKINWLCDTAVFLCDRAQEDDVDNELTDLISELQKQIEAQRQHA